MSKFGRELIASMKQAAAHAQGQKARGLRLTKVEKPNVKAPHRSLGTSRTKRRSSV